MHFYNDNDVKTAAWLSELVARCHLPPGDINTSSINDLHDTNLTPYTQCHFFAGIGGWPLALRLAGWPDDQPVWTGSCPCQPFSVAGRGLGASDPRHLWPAFLKLIAIHRPPVIFGEQVAGKAGRLWLAGIRADLEALGYAVGASDLCAAGVGAPHIRQRLWWVAYLEQQRLPEPWKLWKDTSHNPTLPFKETDRLVDAVRRDALPFLCREHARIPTRVGKVALRGYGNAIVPPLAAEFIIASVEAINSMRNTTPPLQPHQE